MSACGAFAELLGRGCPAIQSAKAFSTAAVQEAGSSGGFATLRELVRWARRRVFRRGAASLERVLELVAGGDVFDSGRWGEGRGRSDGARLRSKAYRDFTELHLLWTCRDRRQHPPPPNEGRPSTEQARQLTQPTKQLQNGLVCADESMPGALEESKTLVVSKGAGESRRSDLGTGEADHSSDVLDVAASVSGGDKEASRPAQVSSLIVPGEGEAYYASDVADTDERGCLVCGFE